MDCLEQFCQEQYKSKPTGFVITGPPSARLDQLADPRGGQAIIATASDRD